MQQQPKRILIVHRGHKSSDVDYLEDQLSDDECLVELLELPPDAPDHPDEEEVLEAVPELDAADVVVVLIDEESASDHQLKLHVEHAHRMDNRLVGVWATGSGSSDLPNSLKMHGDALVPLRSPRLVRVVSHDEDQWCDPTGEDIPPREIPRYNC